jgi:hypothetical protein
MDKYFKGYYGCDAGSLLIGNKDFTCHIGNGYGDGEYPVFISQTVVKSEDKRAYEFVTDVRGTFFVYNYDCYKTEKELTDAKNIIVQLSGWYAIYRNNGKMLLEKWNMD